MKVIKFDRDIVNLPTGRGGINILAGGSSFIIVCLFIYPNRARPDIRIIRHSRSANNPQSSKRTSYIFYTIIKRPYE